MNQQLDRPQSGAAASNGEESEMEPVILGDGTRVLVRSIVPTDSAALQQFHSHLSAWSIYLRFFQYLPILMPDRADYFTHLDGSNRQAIVALDPGDPTAIIAVARFDRDPGTDEAEYAIIVADAWQGRGLGLALTRRLIDVARASGIRHFYAHVLPGNARMLNLFRDLPLHQHSALADGVQRVDIDLYNVPDGQP